MAFAAMRMLAMSRRSHGPGVACRWKPTAPVTAPSCPVVGVIRMARAPSRSSRARSSAVTSQIAWAAATSRTMTAKGFSSRRLRLRKAATACGSVASHDR